MPQPQQVAIIRAFFYANNLTIGHKPKILLNMRLDYFAETLVIENDNPAHLLGASASFVVDKHLIIITIHAIFQTQIYINILCW